ncbi:MAG: FAD-dependent oxidoreductase [Gemmatimonadota bacterium]
MPKTVVVGAGVIGLASAYELARRGHEVTVVDKGEPGKSCSAGNAGWITPSLSAPIPGPGLTWTSIRWMLSKESPLYIAPAAVPHLSRWLWRFWRYCNAADNLAGFHATATLNRLTIPLFEELAKDGFPIELHRRGLLFLFTNRRSMEKTRAEFEVLKEYGYRMPAILDRTAITGMERGLSDKVTSGFTVDGEYHVRPETLTDAYVARIKQLGATIKSGVEVTGPLRHNGKIAGIETASGPIEADNVLIAAGAWTGLVAGKFGARLPVQAGKGYSLTIPTDTEIFSRPLYLGDVKVGVSPFVGALRFAGTMELSGINTILNRGRLDGVLRSVGRYFEAPLAKKAGQEWVGMRPLTPDGLPMLGRAPGHENVYVATGHAMLGITLAPATGRVMGEMMTKKATSVPVGAFEPGRFDW